MLEFLEKEGMLRTDEHTIKATFFGRRVSDLYIDPMSAVKLRDALKAFKPEMHHLGALHAVCSTPDMLSMYMKRGDYSWVEEVLMTREDDLLIPPPKDLTEYEFYLSEIKTACSLDDWVMEMEEDELLTKYGIGPGDLRSKIDVGEWLLYSMRELSNIFNKDAYPLLTELITRVHYGVRPELLPLVKLRGVGRARARSLFNHGISSIDDIRRIELPVLARVPKIGDSLARKLKEQVSKGAPSEGAGTPTEDKAVEGPPMSRDETRDPKQRSLLDF